MQKSGNMLPGPILSGAVARPTIVASEPSICAAISVKRTWKRVKVWRRIIPKPDVMGTCVSSAKMGMQVQKRRMRLMEMKDDESTYQHPVWHRALPTTTIMSVLPPH